MTVVEFWVEQYQTVVAEKKALGDKLRETLEENQALQTRLNNLRASNEAYRSMNSSMSRKLSSATHQTQELKTQLEAEKEENASLRKELEDKAEWHKKEMEKKNELLYTIGDLDTQLKHMTQRCENITLSLKIVNERLDKSIADRKELQADRDIWFRKNGEKQAEIQSLKTELKSIECSRDTWRIEAERLRKEITESYSDGYSDGNEEGQNELWEMLQMVKDMGPNEVDPEYDCIGDVIDMDLEDFKEAYGKWEAEQKKVAEEAKNKHVEYMRDYLKRYCVGKLCFGCPLYNASEPVSSCLFSKLTDEEVEKRYRKVVDSEYKKTRVPVSARLPQPWECSIEAKVEINEDILKVVCGIKDDKNNRKVLMQAIFVAFLFGFLAGILVGNWK